MTPTTIQLFAVHRGAQLTDSQMQKSLQTLPLEDQQRILRYRRWEDRQSGMLAAKLARKMLSDHLHVPASELQIRRTELGRPYLHGFAGWQGDFNVSHSGDWVFGGITTQGLLGVDVEGLREIEMEVSKHCYCPEERDELYSLDGAEQNAFFYVLWTMKEAYIKAIGTGLSTPLTSFGFDIPSLKEGKILLKDDSGVPQPQWHFQRYDVDDAYRFAICSDQQSLPGSITLLTRDEVLN
ncbi:4'-phosphopantetheinyl transferase [Tumebacillus sp. BK434]|uniref:4'-phosphopantetheinyl transferase family protein n=1 Tax=Tumebacillus sp. BK434 TaxID=2512169 RepID=UPI00104ED531|nr:4'-phosphopantetheinyl transferase superfamily protein [Tumebacillus sp. BK434]TCP59056.1 4'-phosphopantetheinyl transferase [Tumebacillus sp. BK434]